MARSFTTKRRLLARGDSVGQLAYRGAHHASANSSFTNARTATRKQGVASPNIANNDPTVLNISMTTVISGSNSLQCPTAEAPRDSQRTVQVGMTLDPVKKGLVKMPPPEPSSLSESARRRPRTPASAGPPATRPKYENKTRSSSPISHPGSPMASAHH